MTPLLGPILGIAGKLLDRLIPDPEARAKALKEMAELEQKGELAFLNADLQVISGQLEVNKMEAQHGGLFKGGWRPFVGWTCGIAFAYHFVVRDVIVSMASIVAFYTDGASPFPVSLLPQLDTASLMTVLLGMLGIGGLRTYEKRKTQASVSG